MSHTQSGDVVDSEQPLYSTGKYIIDDALSSLSKATGSGKIMDNWLRMFTHPSRLAFTNGDLMCLEPVHSECKLGFRDMVFMHALQRFLEVLRDLSELNRFLSLRVSARTFHIP